MIFRIPVRVSKFRISHYTASNRPGLPFATTRPFIVIFYTPCRIRFVSCHKKQDFLLFYLVVYFLNKSFLQPDDSSALPVLWVH